MSKIKKTVKTTAIELYNKKHDIKFISEFLDTDVMTVKSWVLKDDPEKQYVSISQVPSKKKGKEKDKVLPMLKEYLVSDLPSVIKGLTLVGLSTKEIADNLDVSEESIVDMVANVEDIAKAYNYAKNTINIKVVETLFSAIMPRELHEKTFAVDIKTKRRFLAKDVVKEYAGNVEGLYKWLEINAPEKWNTKTKNLIDLLVDCGVMSTPEDAPEDNWEKMAKKQQDVLVEVLDEEERKLKAEYANQDE